jgi:hypothetical protein
VQWDLDSRERASNVAVQAGPAHHIGLVSHEPSNNASKYCAL